MKIDASKRARPRGERSALHQRIIRQHRWQQRLVVGSALALALVLVGWLLGLAWWIQLLAAGLGLAVGGLWRTRWTGQRAERRAFAWIEEQTGLSYQTAVELRGADARGLGDAVRARAGRASALEPPALQPWYLLPLLLTLLLLVLPNIALPDLRTPLSGLNAPLRSAPTAADTPPLPEPFATTPESRPDAPETGSAPDAARPTAESEANDLPFETNRDAQEGAAQAQGEADALEQFLQQNQQQAGGEATGNAGEMTQDQNGPQQAGEPGQDGSQSQQAGQQGQQQQVQQPGEEGGQDGQGRAQQGQRPNEQAQGENRVQEASGASAQPQAVPPDEKMRNTGRTAQESERNNEQTSTEGVDMLQMRNSASREKENLNQMVRDGEASERAGTGPGADIDSSRERLGGNANPADRLTGERGAGPSTMERSAVLGQGQVPTALPEVGTAEAYQRANEEVIREGRVPAAYQTIVRDYFR